MPYIIIILELLTIIYLIIYNLRIRKKSKEVKKTILKIEELTVTRDILSIASQNDSYLKKYEKINKYLIETLNIDYSSLVLIEGDMQEILASNVSKDRIVDLKNYYKLSYFSDDLNQNQIQIKIKEKNKKLDYLNDKDVEIESFMMVPIYTGKKLLGYWLAEFKNKEKITKLDNKTITSIKETLSEIIKISSYQSAFEVLTKDDEFTNFKTREYLFSDIKNEIDQYNKSLIVMIKINNLKEINKKYGRETGNEIITEVSKVIKKIDNKTAQAVRYFGPKLVIAFPDVEKLDNETIEKIGVNKIYNEIRLIEIRRKLLFKVKPKVNIACCIYEGNTRLHKITEKLENYLDNTKEEDKIEKIL